jgi:catechol O-methyltransferase
VETGLEGRFLMNVGSYKGKVVEGIVRGHWDDWSRPFPFDGNVDVKTGREDWESEDRGFTVVELGGYVGYSTILIAAALCERFGVPFGHKSADSTPSTRSVVPHLYTIELNPQFAQNVRDVVKFAGLSHVVTVVTARGDEGLKLLASGEWIRHCGSDNDSSEPEPINRIDILFIDHYKPAYTSDLKVAESLGLIQAPEKGRKGSILVADNVIVPGNPEYLAYVRRWGAPKGEDARAAESISTDAAPGQKPVYVSQQVISWEPTGERDGVEVSWCVGRAVPGVEANEDGAVKLS